MDKKTMELAGIAASIAGHCRPCFLYHHKKAKELGISKKDIREVIELASNISEAGARGMYDFAVRETKKKRGSV